jgi:hypothetical protein
MRALKLAVIVMTVLLLAGFSVVVGELIRRSGKATMPPPPPPQAGLAAETSFGTIALAIPTGCALKEMNVAASRLILRLGDSEACSLILVIDPVTGRELGRFKLTAAP